MNIGRQARSGAMWTIGLASPAESSGSSARSHHHALPFSGRHGEVAAAMALALTANWMTAWGFNQYVIVRGGEGPDAVFPATILHLTLGFAALLVMLLAGVHLADFLTRRISAASCLA